MVESVGHRRVNLHQAGLVTFLFVAQGGPVACRAHRHHGRVFGYQSQFDRFESARFAQGSPAAVVTALVFVDERLRCLNRDVVGLKAHIREERLTRIPTG